jgi:hypothetical protein
MPSDPPETPELWTPEEYRALTALTLEKLREEGGPGPDTVVTMAFDFEAGDEADTDACLRALRMFQYNAEIEDQILTVEVEDVALTLDAIWTHEERLITICTARGFIPDGWGFYA